MGDKHEEIKARFILVKTRPEAEAIILALKKGKSFITLAKEKSLGPSGKNGGNLSFFSKSQMVSPFSKAAFSLREGTYTEKPVKTQFGWHIIKVEDSRFAENRSFEEMENEIKRRLL